MHGKEELPLVSIILPVYNRQNLVIRAIRSVVCQTYDNWELICIDDGSTDFTLHTIQKMQKILGRKLKAITQPHSFLPAARNNGIRHASGEFITFIDSDDEFKPDHIAVRVRYMKDNPDTDMIHGGVNVRGSDWVPDKDDKSRYVHISDCAVGATFFGYDYVFRELKGFKNLGYSEDSEFLARAKSKFSVVRVKFPTYIYHRENFDSITMQRSGFFHSAG